MKKDTRLNLILPKQLKEDLGVLARFAGTSVNDLVCCNLQAVVNRRFEEIKAMTNFDEETRFQVAHPNEYKI